MQNTGVGMDLDELARRGGRADGLAYLRAQAGIRRLPLRTEPVGTVTARWVDGRLLADCPWCAGAELVSPVSRVFFCLSCGNAQNGGHVAAVEVEAEAEGRARG